MEPIILASSSPRRQDILKMLGIPFQVMIPEVNETSYINKLDYPGLAEYLANQKIKSVTSKLPPDREIPWVLAADTIIELDGRIYGKPVNNDEAASFLRELSGRTHKVKTAVVLYNGRNRTTDTRVCETLVTFAELTDEEIDWYVETGEWHGAAGGYRIQSLAQCFIKKIEGSQSCVVGLPICELFDMLKTQGYSIIN